MTEDMDYRSATLGPHFENHRNTQRNQTWKWVKNCEFILKEILNLNY